MQHVLLIVYYTKKNMRHSGLLLEDKREACEACGARPLGEIDRDPLWVSEDVPVIIVI